MKKIYNNVTGFALSAVLCLSISLSASAQRGGEHSGDGKSNNGGGSTPPPAAAPQRPAPQPQVQRSNPQPQVQRSNPQPQQQPQMQRNSTQQNNSYNGGQRNNAVTGSASQPRGAEHQARPVFTPRANGSNYNGGNNSQRRYSFPGQRNYAGNPRAYGFNYSHGNSGYRSFPGLRYGRNYTSPRAQGFYYRNRGYYATYYTPQIGFSINLLPRGYYPFYYGQSQYFYSDGLYYRQEDNDNYTVVEPPVGAAIDKLPTKAQAIAINGNQYYELNGVYYQPITKDDGTIAYQIAGKDGELNTGDDAAVSQDELPQVGDLVDNLPEGCKIVKLNGSRFYVSQEGYYFQDATDTNGDKVYKIVGTPTDEPGSN
jgi:hypothetical protein